MPTRLLAANGEGVLALEPFGASWMSVLRLENAGAECLAVSPQDPQLVFVGCRGHGVQRSHDGGTTFEKLHFPQPDVFSMAVSAADAAVYAGCEPSMLFRSRDDGETWEELESMRQLPSASTWYLPARPWTHHVRAIAPNPHDPRLILAGIERGGVVRSVDDGLTWEDCRPGADKACHALAWHPVAPGRAYQTGGTGSAWSHDGGSSWERVSAGRDDEFRHYVTGLAVDPADPDRWYVTASTAAKLAHGPGHADAAIYCWSGAGPWRKLQGGLPESLDSLPYALAAEVDALYAGLEDGRIWAGTERAERWQPLDVAGDPVRRVRALGVIPR